MVVYALAYTQQRSQTPIKRQTLNFNIRENGYLTLHLSIPKVKLINMRITKLIIATTIIVTGSISCNNSNKDTEIAQDPIISTFFFIRHSEKDRTNPENRDPGLNRDGLGRAMHWAEIFDPVAMDVIYSTNYKRTSMTAAPTSAKKNINIKYYDPGSMDMEAFKADNEGKNVLVVGHSNTTPDFVNKMLGTEKYPQMDDDDNSSLFIVRIIDGEATDIRLDMD